MNNLVKKLIILSMLFIIFLYNNISLATSVSDLKDEKSDVKDDISETEKELDDISDAKSEALEQVEKLITQISDSQNEINDLNSKRKISCYVSIWRYNIFRFLIIICKLSRFYL